MISQKVSFNERWSLILLLGFGQSRERSSSIIPVDLGFDILTGSPLSNVVKIGESVTVIVSLDFLAMICQILLESRTVRACDS